MPDQPASRSMSPIFPVVMAVVTTVMMIAIVWWFMRDRPRAGPTAANISATGARHAEAEAEMAQAMEKELTDWERKMTRRQSDVRQICLVIVQKLASDRPVPQTVDEVVRLAGLDPADFTTAVYIPPTSLTEPAESRPMFFDAASPEDGGGGVAIGFTDGHAEADDDTELIETMIQWARGEVDQAAVKRATQLRRLRLLAEHLFDYADNNYGLPRKLEDLPSWERPVRFLVDEQAVFFPIDLDLVTAEHQARTPLVFTAPTIEAGDGEVGVLFADGSTAYVDDPAELEALAEAAKVVTRVPSQTTAKRLSHLRMIGLPLLLFQSEHGTLPIDPADANTEQVEMPAHLIRPDAVYFRLSEVPIDQLDRVPMMFDAPSIEAGGGEVGVLFANGSARAVIDQAYLDELSKRAEKWIIPNQ